MYGPHQTPYISDMSKTRFTGPSFKIAVGAVVLALVAAGCGSDDDVAFDDVPTGSATITEPGDIDFVEISPFARFGPAQGDFTAGEHGTFGIFGEGAASPPHTHSGSYYAVVLGGEMNNPFGTETDPPSLAPGSFWAVPADEQHLTACLTPDEECRFFFHSAGAFDFLPIDALTDEPTSDGVAAPVGEIDFRSLDPFTGAATMWGDRDGGAHGTIIRLEQGQESGQLAHRNEFTLVPISGSLSIDLGDDARDLSPGSVVEAEANTPHSLGCDGTDDCLFYVFGDSPMEISS